MRQKSVLKHSGPFDSMEIIVTYMLRLSRPDPVILPMVGKIAVHTGIECMTRVNPAVQS